jgi:glycosyltransferase involved in cell wall biosynthesis
MRCPSLRDLPSPPFTKCGWPWTEESGQLPPLMDDGSLWPLVTIITSSFNQGAYIEETIRSILLQAYPNLEYIIMDGGSTDDSVDIIKKYQSWISYWVSEPDRGQTHALNKGIALSQGDVITWINSDDTLLPNALAAVGRASKTYPEAACWIGSCDKIDQQGGFLSRVMPRDLSAEELGDWGTNFFYQPSCFINASVLMQLRKTIIDETLDICFDVDLWHRLIKLGRFVTVNAPLSKALIHKAAKTSKFQPRMAAEHYVLLFRYGFENLALERLTKHFEYHRWLENRIDRITNNRPVRMIRRLLNIFGGKL